MANTYDRIIQLDGWRNAVVKISGVLDTSDAVLAPAISLSDFSNNDQRAGNLVGFRADHVWHSIGNGLELIIEWQSQNPQQIVAVSGRAKESFFTTGGLQPDSTRFGYNGNINIRTTGYNVTGGSGNAPVQNFTVHLELIKLYK